MYPVSEQSKYTCTLAAKRLTTYYPVSEFLRDTNLFLSFIHGALQVRIRLTT